ncbi:hypothetical protein VIGAN_11007400 [Vigna angularis var. angularis]|uniref:Uncharacterized protein n=1 Tax=Vigna angularis var. angularis TaxID=157739 RepID=A0A0S3T7H3_PHAAN|nr:hypothetical protein VIGAN_11007400 [Vigna angularis var. angularis]
MMNVARAIDMDFVNKNRGWHGKEETRMGSYSSYKTSSNISGRIAPRNHGTSEGVNGVGPNTIGESGENNRSGPIDRGKRHLAYQDLLDRRKRGLCFKCGGLYNFMHQCPVK